MRSIQCLNIANICINFLYNLPTDDKATCQTTDTWGQLGLLTTILNHKACINTSRQVLEKTLFAINAIFTQDNNLSKTKVEGSLQKTNATCSKCKTNLKLTYLHRPRRHSSSQSQKRESTILSDKNKITSKHFIRKRKFWSNAKMPLDGSLLQSFSKIYRERAGKPISTNIFLLARGSC